MGRQMAIFAGIESQKERKSVLMTKVAIHHHEYKSKKNRQNDHLQFGLRSPLEKKKSFLMKYPSLPICKNYKKKSLAFLAKVIGDERPVCRILKPAKSGETSNIRP
jgi:hypothetical protein